MFLFNNGPKAPSLGHDCLWFQKFVLDSDTAWPWTFGYRMWLLIHKLEVAHFVPTKLSVIKEIKEQGKILFLNSLSFSFFFLKKIMNKISLF